MKVKMAESINVFLCDHCAAVHIGMWRNGKMFAEAIPNDAEAVARDLLRTIAESKTLQAASPVGRKH
ncbi:hypothetical protein [Mesorhizobium sp. CAU 1741]|uniref:hypothetical protein n=1 Tax=Mesorhizobium sp. CAU 1741 TaxID=3140366 RepID=UPI00325ACAA3